MAEEPQSRGVLYVVATPIGNLDDLTLRAVATLRAADRVLAEDTRRTRTLLTHLGIAGKPLERLDAHTEHEARAVESIVARLRAGERIALVTDAGTPVVSDPGTQLVHAAAKAGIPIVPIPGASAVMAALSMSGLATGGFRFVGFLPRSGPERRHAIQELADTRESVVLFESPQRTAATIAELAVPMPERAAVIARELTKVHEEAVRGSLAELAAAPEREWLGEVTIVLGPRIETAAPMISDEHVDARIDDDLAKGRRARDIAEALALETGRPKRELYDRVVTRRNLQRR